MTVHIGKPDLKTLDTLFDFSILKPLEYEDQYTIQTECRFVSYEADEKIIGFEDMTTDVFFILQGRVRISVRSATGSIVRLGTMNAGQYFGELSTIDDRPQLALVETVEPCLIAACPAAVFHNAVLSNPDAARQLLYDLAMVIRNSAARIAEVTTKASDSLGGTTPGLGRYRPVGRESHDLQ